MTTKAELAAEVATLKAQLAERPAEAPKPKVKRRKTWYRSTVTGDRGYLVEEDGVQYIDLDRPMEQVRRRYDAKEWMVDKDDRPLNVSQMAQIPFAADSALCRVLGYHHKHKGEWANLSDQQRIAWIQDGPETGVRRELYEAVMGAISQLGE